MTSQLHHKFQASHAVHGTDDIAILNFQWQVNSQIIFTPSMVNTPSYYKQAGVPPTLLNQPL